MSDGDLDAGPPAAACVQVWDSAYAPASQAFSVFREGVCASFMPWSPERGDGVFESRIESLALPGGSIGRCRTAGIFARKTRADIANSAAECIYGNYVLAGEVLLEQAGRSSAAKGGDLVLYHSHQPIVFAERPNTLNVNIAFAIPVSRFAGLRDMESRCLNAVVPAGKMIDPLIACLNMLAEGFRSSSPEEIAALFDAVVALLPISVGCLQGEAGPLRPERDGRLGELRRFIADNVANPRLKPADAAERLGVSVRYVHKLFARAGTTFGAYVAAERLERIRADMLSAAGRRAPISALAFRWGFSDLSTFNRAFRRRYGQPPRSYRG